MNIVLGSHRPQNIWSKLMFSQASVILFTGVLSVGQMQPTETTLRETPQHTCPETTPLHDPPGHRPPSTNTPLNTHLPCTEKLLDRDSCAHRPPLGRDPIKRDPQTEMPLCNNLIDTIQEEHFGHYDAE